MRNMIEDTCTDCWRCYGTGKLYQKGKPHCHDIVFLGKDAYNREMRKRPVPASLLALEPNLRPAIVTH